MMTNTISTQDIEDLAVEIGEAVYIDVANWHLFLADAHLHTVLAERFYPLLQARAVTADQIAQVLSEISVALGGGKREIPLLDLIPQKGQTALLNVLEDAERRL